MRLTQIEQAELVRLRGCELMLLDINAAHPVAFSLEFLDEACPERSRRMSTDEPTGAAD